MEGQIKANATQRYLLKSLVAQKKVLVDFKQRSLNAGVSEHGDKGNKICQASKYSIVRFSNN